MILGKEIQELAEWSQDSRNLVGQITIFCSIYPMSSSSTVLPSFEASRSIPMAGPSRRTSSSAVHTWSTKTHQSGMYNNRPSWGRTKQEDSLKQDKIVSYMTSHRRIERKTIFIGIVALKICKLILGYVGFGLSRAMVSSVQSKSNQSKAAQCTQRLRRRQNVRDQGDPEPSESFQSECH